MEEGRVLIVDVMHLAFKAAFGRMPQLTATVEMDGHLQQINTVIPTYVSKTIHRWSKGGYYPTMVCFDGRGSNMCRKAYFKSFQPASQEEETAYKGGRENQNDKFYKSVNLTYNLLYSGGVGVLRAPKYEADDLVKATVDLAKVTYPNYYIDIVTGDADLVPLVDDQVSVFLSSKKRTYAVREDLVKNHYCQITPDNYSQVMEDMTAYKKLQVPYNTLLLVKLLRGDKSDGVPGYPKFTPTKYNNIITSLIERGVDLSSIFKYGNPIEVLCDVENGAPVLDPNSIPQERLRVRYDDPVELSNILNVLSDYLDEDQLAHVRRVYNGINLNGVFYENLSEDYWRKPARINIPLRGYLMGEFQSALLPLKINLPEIR